MIFWIVIAAMTALAIVAVLFPLLRRESGAAAGGSDAEVYRDQLAEVERDFARGVIDETEAKAARIEVSRRLLAATDIGAAKTGKTLSRGPVLAAIGVAIPVVAIGLYLVIGNPGLKGEPLAARMQENPHNQPLIELKKSPQAHRRGDRRESFQFG